MSDLLDGTAPIQAEPKSLIIPELNQSQLAKLAREVAMDIQELPVILGHYGLSSKQFDYIKGLPFFQKVLETVTIEWNSALSTHERVKIEAAAILEEGMPTLGARMLKPSEALSGVVETGKLFAKIAGIGEERTSGSPGEKFTITINLGGDEKIRFEKDVTPNPPLQLEEKPHDQS